MWQVTIVRYGTRQTVRSDVYLNYHLYGEPDGPIGMDYFFWVIRNADRTIVVDTGLSAAGAGPRTPPRSGGRAGLMGMFFFLWSTRNGARTMGVDPGFPAPGGPRRETGV